MPVTSSKRIFAFSVHVLTAAGAAVALFALLAATHGDWPLMFLWLGVALVVDAIDGPLARAANVSALWPNWSGDTLDLVVDYTTYVFVPAYAVAAGSLMPDALALPAAATIAALQRQLNRLGVPPSFRTADHLGSIPERRGFNVSETSKVFAGVS
jgi:phosphatidylcholine synthase